MVAQMVKIPWRRDWLSTLVFLSGELHGQEAQEQQSMGSQRVGQN